MFDKLNNLGKKREPFLVISDFLALKVEVISLGELHLHDIEFSIDEDYTFKKHNELFIKEEPDFGAYKEKFDKVIEQIKSGNTYLLNLTAPTKISSKLSLKEIYKIANAKYKLRYKDEFVCFSPEKFVGIKDSLIETYPMKGTIDASIVDAKEKILSDKKELAEHTMIVDLLRNDLSMVAQDIKVKKFRFVQRVEAGTKELLQVSSHISGFVGDNWHERVGDILQKLLPAGSISGAPKRKTLEIIEEVESYERGFYSGVFGIYDGNSFNSAVMIRFVEKSKEGYIYKSGGGITLDSEARLEYDELRDKVYLP
ncbi:MAG: aminodeoxychorismate synthase component I [Sulfurimonas sp.]|nr:aminodeoxychorismate synthase component I [Sulfurimonas sp.]MDD3835272.1 aminodeoxychorismate synthase component I [Sulfurimonas sp.]